MPQSVHSVFINTNNLKSNSQKNKESWRRNVCSNTTTATKRMPKKGTANAAIMTEEQTGVRMCTTCAKLLPLSDFPEGKRMYTCTKHFKEMKHVYALGTVHKRANHSLRSRAYMDMKRLFGQDRIMNLSSKQILAMLTADQLDSYSKFSLIPKNPEKPLSIENCQLVTTMQRAYVMTNWKQSRDATKYASALQSITNNETAVISEN
jgi:hypothetical protein